MNQRKPMSFSKKSTREELEQAMSDFRQRGGRVLRVEPKYVEEPAKPGYISRKHH
ncbi:MAG: hypothetical protein RRB13_09240 [bacterium]|nr:hypothetical protein [bacterium]